MTNANKNSLLLEVSKGNVGTFNGEVAISTAIEDYKRHTCQTGMLDNISDDFISRLASDSWNAKTELRELFRRSPAWNEELQALVINGNRTHNPDYDAVENWILELIDPLAKTNENFGKILRAAKWFSQPSYENIDIYLDSLKEIAPKAYRAGKKKSRIFKAFCDTIGITDNTSGSKFQKLYALIADELSSKKIDFKLYVSINPAHFLTMSNPKGDERGQTMVSCHSLNDTDHTYNCGCSGYARDNYTFIVFTASDDDEPETLNNRKTSRQILAYKPNSGVLLQSRMYLAKASGESYGGVDKDTEEKKLYRDLVQREISFCENEPNLWTTKKYCENDFGIEIKIGAGFGGYPDWIYSYMNAKISVRADHKDNYSTRPFTMGTYGLCIECGKTINEGLRCEDCGGEICDICGDRHHDLTTAYNADGEEVRVCESCLDSDFHYCRHCHNYHHVDSITFVNENAVCNDCLREYYFYCYHCGEYHLWEEGATRIYNYEYVCNDALYEHFTECDICHEYHYNDCIYEAINAEGCRINICEDCLRDEDYEICEDCGVHVHKNIAVEIDGYYYCPNCAPTEN